MKIQFIIAYKNLSDEIICFENVYYDSIERAKAVFDSMCKISSAHSIELYAITEIQNFTRLLDKRLKLILVVNDSPNISSVTLNGLNHRFENIDRLPAMLITKDQLSHQYPALEYNIFVCYLLYKHGA